MVIVIVNAQISKAIKLGNHLIHECRVISEDSSRDTVRFCCQQSEQTRERRDIRDAEVVFRDWKAEEQMNQGSFRQMMMVSVGK